MTANGPRQRLLVPAVALALCAVALGAAFVPVEVRHSAPFGRSSTFDRPRSIAVRGGHVTANYDGFNRFDLDLRAYSAAERYDLTVHLRPAGADASDLRTVNLGLSADEIWHDKRAFADPYVTVRFPPIADSAGERYYVWVEAGPRNRDDVWTLWAIKSFSEVPAHKVLAALIDASPAPLGELGRVVLFLLMIGTVGTSSWLVAVAATFDPRVDGDPIHRQTGESVASARG